MLIALALISIGLSVLAFVRCEPLNWRFAVLPPVTQGPDTAPFFTTVFDYTAPSGQAHAPGIVAQRDGFSLVWFQGSAEAQADVDIFTARFMAVDQGWDVSAPERLITRQDLGDAFDPQQLVMTLGNTVENQAGPDALYTTVVSVGGWAMASVADVRLDVAGAISARKLNLSPLLNRSHLVKSPMLAYADGSHALPTYFEMGQAYGALVRFAPDGRVADTRRIPGPDAKLIQPMIVPQDAHRAVAFLRDIGPSGRLWVSRTGDGGQTWTRAIATDIANPSAPIAALSLGGDRLLAAMNDDPTAKTRLRLSLSEDAGVSWRVIYQFDDPTGDARYPMLRRLAAGQIILTYSHGSKRGIRAHVFNDAWMAAQ